MFRFDEKREWGVMIFSVQKLNLNACIFHTLTCGPFVLSISDRQHGSFRSQQGPEQVRCPTKEECK